MENDLFRISIGAADLSHDWYCSNQSIISDSLSPGEIGCGHRGARDDAYASELETRQAFIMHGKWVIWDRGGAALSL